MKDIVYAKTYARLKKIPIERSVFDGGRVPSNPVRMAIGRFLRGACGNIPYALPAHNDPIAPSLGCELYLIMLRPLDGLRTGLYHYERPADALNVLWRRDFFANDVRAMFPDAAETVPHLIAVWTVQSHGGRVRDEDVRSIRTLTGEALAAARRIAVSLGWTPISLSHPDHAAIHALLDIDGRSETTARVMGFLYETA